jgi:hypothetical protein
MYYSIKMEIKRQSYKNKLLLDIKELENNIIRSEDTITRLRHNQLGSDYSLSQIEKLTTLIQDKNIILKKLRQDEIDITQGKLDDIINEQYEKNKSINDKKNKEKMRIIATKEIEKKRKKDTAETYWRGMASENRVIKQTDRDMNYELKYFNKIIDSIPSYISNNLSEMPNNKGYIWRGMHIYGDLPAEPGPTVLFEKMPNSLLIIHEYTPLEYKRYEKQGQERKECVFKRVRKEKKCGNSLGDFLSTTKTK